MNFKSMNDAMVEVMGNKISIKAKGNTNLFNGASGMWKDTNFPYYFMKRQGDFLIRSKVSVAFKNIYDLGAIVIYENEDTWIKFAFENSDIGSPAIVSVVTRGTSDDCNGEPISESAVWLQICRQGNVFAMHYSLNKKDWKLARICRIDMQSEVMIGLSTQCPMGQECVAIFEEVEITDNPYKDIRSLMEKE